MPGACRLLRTDRHRSPGVPDRPVQPAVRLLHARRGPGLAAAPVAAHRRRGGAAGGHRGSAAGHHRGPLHRRGAAAAPRAARHSRPGRGAAAATGDLGHHQRHRPGPASAAAGLDRANVSLDTLQPEVFKTLARRDRLDDVLRGLAAAADAGLTPVKVNAVLMRGVNDGEAPALLTFCLEAGYQLRFIEQMPLDAQHGWRRENMVAAAEIMDALSAEFTLTPDDAAARGSAPAETFLVDEGPAKVGIIGSVTRPFCGACDRVRLTADGQIRNCLFAQDESNLRDPMRSGATDEELAELWRRAVATKLPGHGINEPGFLQPARPMSAIGG